MARAKTKEELLKASENNYEKLNEIIHSLSEKEQRTPFDFSGNNKKENHWYRDKNLRDILIHLYEWHQLLLHWVQENIEGNEVSFLPEPYNWRTYGDMNIEFYNNHQNTSLENAKSKLDESHQEVMNLLDQFSDEELFTKGIFKWVGGSTLGSYFISSTASHYDWATKKLKLHIKNCNQ